MLYILYNFYYSNNIIPYISIIINYKNSRIILFNSFSATPLWLISFFSSEVNCAKVLFNGSYKNSGSYPNPPSPCNSSIIHPLTAPVTLKYSPRSVNSANWQTNLAPLFFLCLHLNFSKVFHCFLYHFHAPQHI